MCSSPARIDQYLRREPNLVHQKYDDGTSTLFLRRRESDSHKCFEIATNNPVAPGSDAFTILEVKHMIISIVFAVFCFTDGVVEMIFDF